MRRQDATRISLGGANIKGRSASSSSRQRARSPSRTRLLRGHIGGCGRSAGAGRVGESLSEERSREREELLPVAVGGYTRGVISVAVVATSRRPRSAFRRDRADGNRQKLLSLADRSFAQRFSNTSCPRASSASADMPPQQSRPRGAPRALSRTARRRSTLMLAPPREMRVASCRRIFDVDLERCPKCRDGTLVVRARWRATRLPIDLVIATLIREDRDDWCAPPRAARPDRLGSDHKRGLFAPCNNSQPGRVSSRAPVSMPTTPHATPYAVPRGPQ